MVSSMGAEPICFDYNPAPGSELMLLSDPESSLRVTGKISEITDGNKTFIHEIVFMSPNGAQLTFNPDGIFLRGLSVRDHIRQDDEETVQYGDIQFTEKWFSFTDSLSATQRSSSTFYYLGTTMAPVIEFWLKLQMDQNF